MRKATDEYLADEDSVGAWIDDCCVVGPNQRCLSSDLWAKWKAEREKANEHVGSQTKFGRVLTDRGFIEERSGVRYRRGISLKPPPPPWTPYVERLVDGKMRWVIDFNDAMSREELKQYLERWAPDDGTYLPS